MASYTTENIRTVALLGHGSAGKTTLAEALLVRGGAISAAGSVEKGTTVSDSDPLEKSVSITTEDVETVRRDRWVGSVPGSSKGPVPDHVAAKLSRFINVGVA